MRVWSGVLNSCPGLLCCVVNTKGKLLYATHGYKAVASRIFGHKCEEGRNYPPMITELDRTLHEILTGACLGKTDAIEITEGNKIWELTISPLRIDEVGIAGVVMRIIQSEKNNANNLPPVIKTNPEILNTVPFMAGVVDKHGIFLAANKFLSSSSNENLTGKNILDIVDEGSRPVMLNVILKSSGSVECRISEIFGNEKFYDLCPEIYHDKDFDDIPTEQSTTLRQIRIHASPLEWDGNDAVMLTFEDITEFNRTHEQLRRLLTFDRATGILNRRGIEHLLLHEFHDALRNNEHLSLIVLGIDDFKSVNKSLGYMAGNKMLREFVNVAKKFLSDRANSVLGRFGGDEFVIIAHCSGAAAVVLANEICAKSEAFTISAGVANLHDGLYSGVNEFIAAAYDAMTEAKNNGGNQTVLARRK